MSKASTIRPKSLGGTVKAVALMIAFMALGVTLTLELYTGIMIGALTFLVYRYLVVRHVLLRLHRRGVGLTHAGRFVDAIPVFQDSERWWMRHAWLDDRRGWLLGSAGPWPFRILSRYNQAYCLTRLNRGTEAIQLLDGILAQAPDMTIARELRDVLQAGWGMGERPPAPE